MKLEWMGRYRDFVDSLVKFGNIWSQSTNTPGAIKISAYISGTELQVLEYILENEELNLKMTEVADRLYIPHSTFSNVVRELVEKGLLERFRTKTNKKNIIIRASKKGREAYLEYVSNAVNGKWGAMFKKLDALPPEAITIMTDMFNEFSGTVRNGGITEDKVLEEDELVKIP